MRGVVMSSGCVTVIRKKTTSAYQLAQYLLFEISYDEFLRDNLLFYYFLTHQIFYPPSSTLYQNVVNTTFWTEMLYENDGSDIVPGVPSKNCLTALLLEIPPSLKKILYELVFIIIHTMTVLWSKITFYKT